jgi:hypothetical protein
MNTPAYRKLPGSRRGFFTRSSVWLGQDHVLLVEGTRVHERYQRVYLRDVLGMVVLRRTRFIVQVYWIASMLLLPIVAAFVPANWRATSLSVAGGIDIALLIALYVLGIERGCKLFFATAVGNVLVRPVFRLGTAQKLLNQLEPVILAAQGAPLTQ